MLRTFFIALRMSPMEETCLFVFMVKMFTSPSLSSLSSSLLSLSSLSALLSLLSLSSLLSLPPLSSSCFLFMACFFFFVFFLRGGAFLFNPFFFVFFFFVTFFATFFATFFVSFSLRSSIFLLGDTVGWGPGTSTCVVESMPTYRRLIKCTFKFLFSHRNPFTTMVSSCSPGGTSRNHSRPFFSSE